MVSANHWRGLKENNNKRNWLNFYFFGVLVIVPYPMVDTNHWKGLVNNVSFETIGCSYKVLTIEMQLVDSIQFNCFSSLPLWSTSIIGFIKIESGLLKLLNLTLQQFNLSSKFLLCWTSQPQHPIVNTNYREISYQIYGYAENNFINLD